MIRVSIIIPCFNEQRTIQSLLEALNRQTFARQEMEVVIADGMSNDGTRQAIAEYCGTHPELVVRVVDNPRRIIPAALNTALKAARGNILVRMDAHTLPHPDYVERCVADLEAGLGENVGGIWEIIPGASTWVANAIARAAAHPLGAGDALYRHTRRSAYVDTVPFGAFRRETLALVGFFNEELLTNEDYEFNVRIRERGGRVWLDTAIRSHYMARATLGGLVKQYFRYGYWKWRMLQRYPRSLRWRQALPPVFVLSLVGLIPLAVLMPILRWLLGVELGAYLLVLLAAGVRQAKQDRQGSLAVGLPLAIMCMHMAWGSGFLWSMIGGIFQSKGSKG